MHLDARDRRIDRRRPLVEKPGRRRTDNENAASDIALRQRSVDQSVLVDDAGDLFVEKYNNKDAARSFQEALKAAPDYGPALLGMARSLADQNTRTRRVCCCGADTVDFRPTILADP